MFNSLRLSGVVTMIVMARIPFRCSSAMYSGKPAKRSRSYVKLLYSTKVSMSA